MFNPFLIGKKIYLRAPEGGDEEIKALSENHPDPRESLFNAFPSTLEYHRDHLKRLNNDDKTIIFTICTKEPDKPIGITAFFRLDWVSKAAIYYIAIAEARNWSQGYGKEVTQLMVSYAFETLNLNRIQLHVAAENERAIQVYRSIGFIEEGTLREAMFHRGKYCDFYVMGLLKRDWEKQNKE